MEHDRFNYTRMLKRRVPRKRPEPPAEPLYIGRWLVALGMKAVELKKITELNEGYISQLVNNEKHQKNPSRGTVRLIADAMGIEVEDLYKVPPDRDFLNKIDTISPSAFASLRARRPLS